MDFKTLKTRKMLTKTIFTLSAILIGFTQLSSAQITKQRGNPPRENTVEQMKKPYVIFISNDGFRYDYAEKYHAENIIRLSKTGVSAKSMIPVFPSSTGPNHYSLVTGLYPVHTGIIGNNFYDPIRKVFKNDNNKGWLIKEPIWITAEKQGTITASLAFIASNQKVDGVQTSYYYGYDEPRIGMTERVDIIKQWLSLPEKVRPHFIAVYNNETDHAGHEHGPDAKETGEAVKDIDSFIEQLQVVIKKSGLPVNVVFVSDHGMAKIEQDQPIKIPSYVDTAKFVTVDHRALMSIHAKDPKEIEPLYRKLKAENNPRYTSYLQKDLPTELNFDMKEDRFNRIGDIVLMAKWPNLFTKSPKGSHGFNPYEIKDVHASFYAWGPAFKNGLTVAPFSCVEVYGMMMEILDLKPEKNDGTGLLAKQILK